jgi:hypothetical protein
MQLHVGFFRTELSSHKCPTHRIANYANSVNYLFTNYQTVLKTKVNINEIHATSFQLNSNLKFRRLMCHM